MANMSYCRFENTYRDFYDCRSAIEDMINGEERSLSSHELQAAKSLAKEAVALLSLLADVEDLGVGPYVSSVERGDAKLDSTLDKIQKLAEE